MISMVKQLRCGNICPRIDSRHTTPKMKALMEYMATRHDDNRLPLRGAVHTESQRQTHIQNVYAKTREECEEKLAEMIERVKMEIRGIR